MIYWHYYYCYLRLAWDALRFVKLIFQLQLQRYNLSFIAKVIQKLLVGYCTDLALASCEKWGMSKLTETSADQSEESSPPSPVLAATNEGRQV